jgi:hypothetical protein
MFKEIQILVGDWDEQNMLRIMSQHNVKDRIYACGSKAIDVKQPRKIIKPLIFIYY